jgi:hypothetical protein
MKIKSDITYCSNGECDNKSSCMRSLDNLRSHSSKWLSVSAFIPDENNHCEYKIEREKED